MRLFKYNHSSHMNYNTLKWFIFQARFKNKNKNKKKNHSKCLLIDSIYM